MGTLTTLAVYVSLILVAISMFVGFKGIVGPRASANDQRAPRHLRWRFGRSAPPQGDASKRRAA